MSIDNDDVDMSGCNEWLLKDEGMGTHAGLRRAAMLHGLNTFTHR